MPTCLPPTCQPIFSSLCSICLPPTCLPSTFLPILLYQQTFCLPPTSLLPTCLPPTCQPMSTDYRRPVFLLLCTCICQLPTCLPPTCPPMSNDYHRPVYRRPIFLLLCICQLPTCLPPTCPPTVNSLLFARTLFSLIFANLIPRKFKILAKYEHVWSFIKKNHASRI